MSLTNTFEADILKLIFQAVAITDIAENDTSAPLANLFVSLHTADPGEAPGTEQTTSETTYTGYGRVTVARTSGGWAVAGTAPTTADNVAAVTFGACTSGSPLISHVGVGTLTSGTGKLLLSGALTASLQVNPGITPQFAIGALDITLD